MVQVVKPTVAHVRERFLPLSETFIYQFMKQGQAKTRPVAVYVHRDNEASFRAFPEDEVVEADIAGPDVDLAPFEVVNVMNILYHIVEPSLFERALANLASLTAPGGWLVLSDALGSREMQPASHVRFRPLASYQDRLPQLGFAIKVVEPAHILLNGGVSQAMSWAPSRVQRLVRRGEEALAPILYALDGSSILARWANMRILVAQKVFSTGG